MALLCGTGASSRAIRVTAGAVAPVREELRVHMSQLFETHWAIAAGDAHTLSRLSLELPGLMVVRVNPALRGDDSLIAKVRVSSDATTHLDGVRLSVKRRRSELRIKFKTRKAYRTPVVGALVTEIELAYAFQIEEIHALGGGDVVVSDGVLANTGSVSVLAYNHTRVFVDQQTAKLNELGIGSIRGGFVFFTAKRLDVREIFGCSVMGNGGIHVDAGQLTTGSMKIGAIGDAGSVNVRISKKLTSQELEASAWGSGSVSVLASLTSTDGLGAFSTKLTVLIEGRGCIDVAAVAAQTSQIRIRDNGRAVVQAMEGLALDCDACATVECVGSMSASLRDAVQQTCRFVFCSQRLPAAALVAPVPPTVMSAFENLQPVRTKKWGLRSKRLESFFG